MKSILKSILITCVTIFFIQTTYAQDPDKTVTLTVSGTGKTLEEAKSNALRSAIEQAFGAFISSKTEILNDNLVKDEIVSVASGNVQKYDVVSQIEIPNTGYAITLSATVSISKLTSFAESKGVIVEFKGGMFAANIKLQKLNEDGEQIAVSNLISTAFTLLSNSIDFDLKVSDPILQKYSTTNYDVNFTVSTKVNNNYNAFEKYFIETLSKLFLKDVEVENYKKINKPIYLVLYGTEIHYLRNKKSIKLLINFFANSQIVMNSFKIHSNLGTIQYTYSALYNQEKRSVYGLINSNPNQSKSLFNSFYVGGGYDTQSIINQIQRNWQQWLGHSYYIADLLPFVDNLEQITVKGLLFNDLDRKYSNQFDDGCPLSINLLFRNPTFNFTKTFKLEDLEKINEFKIEKLEIENFLINIKKYILPEEKSDWSCFLKGTLIRTPNGNISIENIKIGDEVVCFDDKGELHTSIVESVNKHENQEVYKYNVWNGGALYATPNHWVLTSENSFTEIGKLNELLTLVDINGGLKPITKVDYFGKETVYNFIVKDYHTYIANDIRVHNGGKGKYRLNISKN